MHLKYRRTCRACGSAALVPAINLLEQHIQTDFAKPGQPQPVQRVVPLALVRCDPMQDENACGLLQLSVSVPPKILYDRYWYRSGTNRTMTEHLRGIAATAQAITGKPGSILDIGCNDGTLLAAIDPSWKRVGIDPSDVVKDVPLDIEAIRGTYPDIRLTGRQFDVITSIACFYDLEDPRQFAMNIRVNLADEGVWVFEQSYMPRMFEQLSYDTICHEHLEYYSLAVIEKILASASLRVFDVEFNEINGGSIRCYAAKRDSEWVETPAVTAVRRREFDLLLDTGLPYGEFTQRMWAHKAKLSALLMHLKAEGKSIHVYGASTKGNTLLQFCNIDNTVIDVAADRSPYKWGAKTVGTNIPIVSEEESRAMRPDYYLVLPWHFREEFLERERATLEAGTKFIFPLPEIAVVGATEVEVLAA